MPNLKGPSVGALLSSGGAMQPRAQINRVQQREREERFLNRRELRALIPVSDMTVWRWMRDPEIAFPKPSKLGRNGRNFWWLPAILDWQRSRAANSGGAHHEDSEAWARSLPEVTS
jgi:predicted DNA-binding transcriptional regulator AlpA